MHVQARRPARIIAVTAAVVIALAGCGTAVETTGAATPAVTHSSTPTPAPTPTTPAEVEPTPDATPAPAGSALATVDLLEVKGRAPRTGYDRDAFAYREFDLDRNGCDVRNDILRRDLRDITVRPGTNGCVVETGVLDDPYSGRTIDFVRGSDTSGEVQIDHVVALSDAWQKGAQSWDSATMQRFGNDPLNLLAVDGPLNGAKGDGDTATWLPPNTSYRCAYVARQVAVKHAYSLWVTQAEKDAMVRVLSDCPGEPLPEAEPAPLMPELEGSAPAQPAPPAPAPQAPAGGGTDPQYPTCKAAKAAGFGPYVRGVDPEYDWYRDGDGDGTVCE
ncbi:DUF1524 domain-containing protein [Georgenia wutianyii]|uniref:DUF1524 domain-containing protein n=1 Tax=Georgenia wutianyii TaxID=2585135 RepID=A0ABX5VS83_9MICO|nr:DUF1524 domain-containing protein [Georgenia wutianyii]QDB79540.1 DUF1524 domain-containing protein [Georgenia wutianyii]